MSDLQPLHATLTYQSATLQSELEQFTAYTTSQTTRTSHPFLQPEQLLNRLRNDIQREVNLLAYHGEILGFDTTTTTPKSEKESLSVRRSANRITRSIPDLELAGHRIRSSNVNFLWELWLTVKQLTGIIAIRKQVRFVSTKHSNRTDEKRACQNVRERSKLAGAGSFQTPRGGVSTKEPVVVDVMCDGGRTWVKLFTKSMEWLGMDLAKQGLVDVHEDDEVTGEDFRGLKVVKMAGDFLAASRTARVGHRHPTVVVILPRIERGLSADVDMVLSYVKDMGVKVVTGNDLAENGNNTNGNKTNSDTDLIGVFDRMIAQELEKPTTDVLNLDCTILIALISDISHIRSSDIKIPAHYNGRPSAKDILGQLKIEPSDPLLPNHIYPILAGKRLVCTNDAVRHLQSILNTMGSVTEVERARIFFPDGQQNERSGDALRHRLQDMSIHEVPHGLQLPIEVVDTEYPSDNSQLPHRIMQSLAGHARLTELNQSVFFHGWSTSITTVTLNRVVAEWLDRAIDGMLDEFELEEDSKDDIAVKHDFQGPKMLVCGRERSLLGNDKV